MSQNKKEYSFKSSGVKRSAKLQRRAVFQERNRQKPVGIKTPLALSRSSSSLLTMHNDAAEQIRDNFRNMLMTNHGERLGRFDYGANLLPIAFELASEDGDLEAQERIRTATTKFFPFIKLISFEPLIEKFDDDHVLKIGARVTYQIPSHAPDRTFAVEFIIHYSG